MSTATIKIKAFPYYVETYDPSTDTTALTERLARLGETVELSDRDLRRAKRLDAIEEEQS